MIHFSHVYKTYPGPIHALRDIDLKIGKGELVYLTGPSGAGKTTLFKMLSAFDRVTSGQIEVAGYSLHDIRTDQIPDFRRKIGVVFQDFKLLRDRTIFDNVALPLSIRGDSEQSIRDKVNFILDEVGLFEKADQFPEMLSGGEQQRTAIARALIHKPEVLIADEPTGNLDPELAEEIMDMFERACAQGTTIFIATHDHEMVRRRQKRVVKISAGELIGGSL